MTVFLSPPGLSGLAHARDMSLDPAKLGQLGRRLEELLDPDGVQARGEAKIGDHETQSVRETGVHPEPGPVRVRWADPRPLRRRRIRGAHRRPDALSAPQPEGPDGEKDERSPAQRRYDAIIEIGRRQLHHPATSCGDGGKAQIRVTIPLTSLTDRIGHGVLDDGTEISPTLARMLACDAGIIPAILNTHGQPVDVGREHRLYTAAPRTAIEIRDGACTWPGCRATRHTEADSERASQRGTSKEHPGSTTPTDHPTPNRLATRRRRAEPP